MESEFRFHFLTVLGASEIAEEAQIGAGDAFGQAGGGDLFQADSTKMAAVICTVYCKMHEIIRAFSPKKNQWIASSKMHGGRHSSVKPWQQFCPSML